MKKKFVLTDLNDLGPTHFSTFREPCLGRDPYFGNRWNNVKFFDFICLSKNSVFEAISLSKLFWQNWSQCLSVGNLLPSITKQRFNRKAVFSCFKIELICVTTPYSWPLIHDPLFMTLFLWPCIHDPVFMNPYGRWRIWVRSFLR